MPTLPTKRIRHTRVERLVERDANFRRPGGPRDDRLRRLRVGIGNFENLAFALWPRAPIGQTTVAADVKIALRGNGQVERQHAQARDQKFLAHVAVRRLDQTHAPDFAARFARHKRVAFPPFRAEQTLGGRSGKRRVKPLNR